MRFHRFELPEEDGREAYIDLDRVHAIMPDRTKPTQTLMALPNGAVAVAMSISDTLALVEGRTPASVFARHLDHHHSKITGQMP